MKNRLPVRTAAISALLASLAGCANDHARLAEAERRIDVLQRHVVVLESILLDDDGDDAGATQLALATTRPTRVTTRPAGRAGDALVRLHAERATHLANLANAETIAYRARRIIDEGDGFTTALCTDAGPLRNTGRQLDVAINGDGFLCVKAADGALAYTRSGNLFIDKSGTLVLGSVGGPRLVPALTIPPNTTNVDIAEDGTVAVYVKNTPAAVAIGRLQLARFADATRLAPLDAACFAPTPASGDAQLGSPGEEGFGVIEQHFLEQSNVLVDRERAALRDVERLRDGRLEGVTP